MKAANFGRRDPAKPELKRDIFFERPLAPEVVEDIVALLCGQRILLPPRFAPLPHDLIERRDGFGCTDVAQEGAQRSAHNVRCGLLGHAGAVLACPADKPKLKGAMILEAERRGVALGDRRGGEVASEMASVVARSR
jgi:hypothetical protein